MRFLLSVLRIVPELERSPDLVVQIAGQGSHLLDADLSPRSRCYERLGDHAVNISRRAAYPAGSAPS